ERRDLGVGAGLGDDGSAVGVADEDHGFVLGVDDLRRRGDVALERHRRVLDHADVVAVLPQEVVDLLPAGTVDEPAVDQDDARGCGSCVQGDSPVLVRVTAVSVLQRTAPAGDVLTRPVAGTIRLSTGAAAGSLRAMTHTSIAASPKVRIAAG